MNTETKVKLILDKHNRANNNCLALLALDEERNKTIVDAMIEAFELGEISFKEKAIQAIENQSIENEKINADDSWQSAYSDSVNVIKSL